MHYARFCESAAVHPSSRKAKTEFSSLPSVQGFSAKPGRTWRALIMADQSSNNDRIVEIRWLRGHLRQRCARPADPGRVRCAGSKVTDAEEEVLWRADRRLLRACVAVDEDTRTLDLPPWVIPSKPWRRLPTGSGTATRSAKRGRAPLSFLSCRDSAAD